MKSEVGCGMFGVKEVEVSENLNTELNENNNTYSEYVLCIMKY